MDDDGSSCVDDDVSSCDDDGKMGVNERSVPLASEPREDPGGLGIVDSGDVVIVDEEPK